MLSNGTVGLGRSSTLTCTSSVAGARHPGRRIFRPPPGTRSNPGASGADAPPRDAASRRRVSTVCARTRRDLGAEVAVEELGEVADDEVGVARAQRLGVAAAVDADDQPDAGRA